MKITRVSLQSKLDELILFFHTYSSMKTTRVSLQSNLDELIQLLHTLFSSIDTCVAMTSVHPASIAVKHASFSSLSLNGIDEIMIMSIKSYFPSHKGRRPNVRRPNVLLRWIVL